MSIKSIEKYIGVFLGGCYGDILGSSTEGMSRKDILDKYGKRIKEIIRNNYTDDTEMTLVLARHLSKNKNIDTIKLHEEYKKEMLKYKRGYSRSTYNTVTNLDYEKSQIGYSSHNGAVMRISPLGLINFSSDTELFEEIKKALYYTHGGNEESVYSAYLHCKIINYLINDVIDNDINIIELLEYIINISKVYIPLYTKVKLMKFLLYNNTSLDNITEELFGNCNHFQIKAMDCIVTALYIFFHLSNKNFTPDIIISSSAAIGGDTDTISKLVGEYLGAIYGYKWIYKNTKELEADNELLSLAIKLYEN